MLNPEIIFLIHNSGWECTKSALIIIFQGDNNLPGIFSSTLGLTFVPGIFHGLTHLPLGRPATGKISDNFLLILSLNYTKINANLMLNPDFIILI